MMNLVFFFYPPLPPLSSISPPPPHLLVLHLAPTILQPLLSMREFIYLFTCLFIIFIVPRLQLIQCQQLMILI